MNLTKDKKIIAKGLRDLADQLESSDWAIVDYFDIKADIQRDFITEAIKEDGYKHFAPTGRRQILLKLSYQLPFRFKKAACPIFRCKHCGHQIYLQGDGAWYHEETTSVYCNDRLGLSSFPRSYTAMPKIPIVIWPEPIGSDW